MIEKWRSINKNLAYVSSLLIVLLMLIVVFNVVMRYFFLKPQDWVDPFSTYILLWATFLTVAWTLIIDGHVSIDVLYSNLTRETQRIFKLGTNIMSFAYCFIFTYIGFNETLDCYWRGLVFIGLDIDIPQWPIMVVLPVGSFLMMIQCAIVVVVSLKEVLGSR